MLKTRIPKYYKVKRGQTLKAVSMAFGVAVGVLIRENGLREEPFEGQVLYIPDNRGDRYVVQAGDTRTLICGSDERYFQKNGTYVLYPEMHVIL